MRALIPWLDDLADITLSPATAVASATADEGSRRFLTLVSYGVRWNPGCVAMWRSLEAVRLNNVTKGIQCLMIDEDECLEFCEAAGFVVGTPALSLYFGGKKRSFVRTNGASAPYFLGALNEEKLERLIQVALEQLTRDGRLDKIKVPF